MTTIGIDIGGTRIKGVVITVDGEILHQLYLPTNDADGDTWKKGVADAVNELANRSPAKNLLVGISAPGLPGDKNEAIAFMPGRLQGLENFNWTTFLDHRTYVVNDAIAALMAEVKTGVAKNKKNVVLLTLGTGVGGAILIDGKPYQGAFNKAGHIGHMVIDDEGDVDVTGMPGSLEDAMGNCTIAKRSQGRFLSTHALLEAYRAGDQFAKDTWLRAVRKLALGLASITNILSPEMIVLGGGITDAGEDLFSPLKKYMEKYEWRPGGNCASIVKATHGDMAGAIGAVYFALEKYY